VTGRNPDTLAAALAALGPTALFLSSDSASLADALALGAQIGKHAAGGATTRSTGQPRLEGSRPSSLAGRKLRRGNF
jgi:hypothetical protein